MTTTATPSSGIMGLTNGESAWECADCGKHNDGRQPSCLTCDSGMRPDLTATERLLVNALEPTGYEQAAFVTLRNDSAGDALIESQVAAALAQQKNVSGLDTDDGQLAWHVDEGRKPQLWLGVDSPPERGKPDLAGKALIRAVRELYAIPPLRGRSKTESNGSDKPAATAKSKPAEKPIADAIAAGTRLDIPLGQIQPSPFQPRTVFDAATIKQLGSSIKQHGQTSDCLVRQVGAKRFELIGGERRFRACQSAKIKTLACKVIVADDDKARELSVFDNLDREDLNELDRIRAYQGLLDAGIYAKQQDLADTLGIKAGTLSNLLRVLRLPADWLELISQEKLPITHARYVVPWVDRPAVMKELKAQVTNPSIGIGDVGNWQYAIQHAVQGNSRPLSGEFWGKRPGDEYSGYHTVRLTNKEAARDDLDVVNVKRLGRRAFNVKLWEELQTAGEERAAQRAGGKTSTSTDGKQATASEARAKAKKQREQFAKRLWIYRTHWLQRQIGARIQEQKPAGDAGDRLRVVALVLYFTEYETRGAGSSVFNALGNAKRLGAGGRAANWKTLTSAKLPELWTAAATTAAAWVQQNPFGYSGALDDETVVSMAKTFGVDVKRDWTIEKPYLDLLNKDQLQALADEWKVTNHKAWTASARNKRTELIEGFLAVGRAKRLRCPQALASAKRPSQAIYV